MLQHLAIRNLALMDAVALEFDGGFTVVTGETGAGKSVLLGALSLLAGNRAEKTLIRQGAPACEVEGLIHFADSGRVDGVLRNLGLPQCEDGALVLSRHLHRTRAAAIKINGALATLAALRELAGQWIDFHGPGEPQKLFQDTCQLEMLDIFAGCRDACDSYTAAFKEWKQCIRRREELRRGGELSEDEAAFIRGQLETLEAVDLDADALEQLERDFSRIARMRDLTEWATGLDDRLRGEGGVTESTASLLKSARALADVDAHAEPLLSRLEALAIEAEDLGGEFAQMAADTQFDEETIRDVQERMQAWLGVKRKYGPTLEDVRAKMEALKSRLESKTGIEQQLEALRREAAEIEQALREQAAELRRLRQKAASRLAGKTRKILAKLGFRKAGFKIEVVADRELGPMGDCHCTFLFAPNTGVDPLPLNKIASSGETARVMLALKTVLAEMDQTPLLVFDEVDANVGGEIGVEVGRELAALANCHQVLCVTHLPQVAAWGRAHLLVEKRQSDSRATILIRPVDACSHDRESELARMLGDRNSGSALSHARELLAKTTAGPPPHPLMSDSRVNPAEYAH